MQGHLDSPLTEKGIAQAFSVKKCLSKETIDFIYSSSCKRTLETATIIADGKPIIPNDNLKEIKLGVMEGKSLNTIKKYYPNEYNTFWNQPSKFKAQDAETFQELQKRTVAEIKNIIKAHPTKSVVIVTHAAVIKTVMAYFENKTLDELWNPPPINNGAHIIATVSKEDLYKFKVCNNRC